jgi:hypothetical protein
VAAYFGDAKAVTEEQVQHVYDDAQAKFKDATGGTKKLPLTRQDVVDNLVSVDALRQIAKQHGVPATAIPADAFVQTVGLPADAEYMKVYAEVRGLLDALGQQATAVQPTEADLHDIYNRFAAAGYQVTYAQFTSSLTAANRQQISSSVALRNGLRAESAGLHITVNPRYQAPAVPVLSTSDGNGGTLPLVDVTFGGGSASAPVTDLP